MKRSSWTVAFVGFAALALAMSTFAQSATPARGGIGLGVSISDTGDLTAAALSSRGPSGIAPAIFVPIDITSRFRLEPEVGMFRGSLTSTYTIGRTVSLSETLTNTGIRVGTGVFGVSSKERFKTYYGARVGYLRTTHRSSESASASSELRIPGLSVSNEVTIPGFFVAPTVGGEYFLSENLSLGGEVQVKYTSWDSSERLENVSGTSTSTHGALVLRFYFTGAKH